MTENDRDLNDRILGRNKKDRSPHIEVSGRFLIFMAESAYYDRVFLYYQGGLRFFYPMQLVTPSVVAIAVRMLMAI